MNKRLKQMSILDALDENMMEYTSYILMNRVLPMVEDGYRASQRRILTAMNNMKATKFTKCQQIDGETIGKYHPHGGVYGVMVNMTTTNYQNIQPIIGKGNFGDKNSSDLTPAAARYTEAKLSDLALDMLDGIKLNEVDFEPNFDETIMIPKFIPFKYPNILCNNLQGMAVGYATNIPSFNMKEVCEATIKYIKTGEHTQLIPDYPTGGYVMKNDAALESMAKDGKGTIYIKSKVYVDEKNREIHVKEIPYTTTREAIVNKIIDLVRDKKLPDVSDVKDLSGKRGQKITIYYKRGTDVNALLDKLYAMTPMISSDSANMNLIVNGRPVLLGTNKIIEEWVAARRQAIVRGIDFKIGELNSKVDKMQEQVDILTKILTDVDTAISIIRFEKRKTAVEKLSTHFEISEEQAKYVYSMPMYNINEEEMSDKIRQILEIKKQIEKAENSKQISELNKKIIEQLEECSKKYGVDRKSEIIEYEVRKIERAAKKIEDNKKYRVILTKENYIKKTLQNGEPKLKDGDTIIKEIVGDGNCEVACFLNDATCRKIRIKDIPESNLNTLGEYLPVLLGLKNEKIVLSTLLSDNPKGFILAIFGNNKVNKIDIKEYTINRRVIEKCYNPDNGLIYLKHHEKDVKLKVQSNKKAALVDTSKLRCKGRTAVGIYTLPKEEKINKIAYVK